MSKTDKDAPYRIRTKNHPRRQESHGDDCEFAERFRFHCRDLPCDIDKAAEHDSGKSRKVERGTSTITDLVWNPRRILDEDHEPRTIEVTRTYNWRRSIRTTPGCDYQFPKGKRSSWYYTRHSRHDERKLGWYGPARSEERDRLREAAKDYRGNGDTEHVELDHQQHRHSVEWDVGW